MKKLPFFFVIPDTQALFDPKERADDVNPAFVRALKECAAHCACKLVIPETVRAEILYQKIVQAQLTAERAREGLRKLGALTGTAPLEPPDNAQIQSKIEAKVDSWLRAEGGTIARNSMTPNVWEKIIDDAVWRRAPFEGSEDGKHEKGFRDALIKASVEEFAVKNSKNECAFVSNDALLREALNVTKHENVTTFDSIWAFVGHVSLLREKFDQAHALALQLNAQLKFYSEEDPECVYTKEKVDEKIRTAHELMLRNPRIYFPLFQGQSPPRERRSAPCTQFGNEKIVFGGTSFSGWQKPKRFEWKSRVAYVGAFVPSSIMIPSGPCLRKTMFEVSWTSDIDNEKITNAKLVEPISLVNTSIGFTTYEELKRYGFGPPPGPPPENVVPSWSEARPSEVLNDSRVSDFARRTFGPY